MEYHREDYDQLYGQKNTSNTAEGWSMVCWLICLIVLAALLGCDGQDAANTAQDEQQAYDKKVALMGMPCTWVAVCIHDPCSVLHRRCAPADLTERRK